MGSVEQKFKKPIKLRPSLKKDDLIMSREKKISFSKELQNSLQRNSSPRRQKLHIIQASRSPQNFKKPYDTKIAQR